MEEDDLKFEIEGEIEPEQEQEQKEEDLENYNFEIQSKNFTKLLDQEPTEEKEEDEDDEMNFEEEEVKGGEQFGAVRPWLGALCAPNNPPKNNPSPPDRTLEPNYVFGYRCGDCRDNIHYLKNNDEIVYMTASIGVVLNKKTNKQRWFGCGDKNSCKQCHNDDILSIAVHPLNRDIVATGQVGKNPIICVWDSKTMKTLSKFNQGVNTRAVKTIGFSKCGKYLATTAADNDNSILIFDWEGGKCLGKQKSGDDPIIDLDFSTTNSKQFATAGKRGMKFWDFSNPAKVNYHKGIFGKEKMSDMTSVQYFSDGKAVSGSVNGALYVWMGNSCSKTVKAHKGFVSAIAQGANDRIITGGNDGVINIFNKDLKLEKNFKLGSSAVGIDENADGCLIVGLRNGSIIEILPNGTMLRYLQSHSDGEVWGLAICPNTGYILTSADDNKVLIYDALKHRCIGKTIINSKKGPQRKIGAGASSLSNLPPNQQARALAISKSGHVAIGINNGSFQIRQSVRKLDQVIATKTEPKEWIEAMRYSPDDSLLAVTSHDNNTYIYKSSNYNLQSICKGHTSYITSVDFSLDSQYIQTACGAYDYLFFNVSSGEQMKSGGSMFRDEKWATQSSKLGWWVQGIFPSGVDGTHVNGVDRSNDEELIAVADDWGLVNLYRNPALDGNKPRSFMGHSEHVVRALFDNQDKFVYSIGGYDQTLIQWKLV